MEEIKRTLASFQRDNEDLLNRTKKMMSNGNQQWYRNDLTLQQEIAEMGIKVSQMMTELIKKLDQNQVKPDKQSVIKTDSEIAEDEEDVLRRFRS